MIGDSHSGKNIDFVLCQIILEFFNKPINPEEVLADLEARGVITIERKNEEDVENHG